MTLNSIHNMVQLTERSFLEPEQLGKKLLVIPNFQYIIREEFDNAQLEYKDFSDYQDKYIKKRMGKVILYWTKSMLKHLQPSIVKHFDDTPRTVHFCPVSPRSAV